MNNSTFSTTGIQPQQPQQQQQQQRLVIVTSTLVLENSILYEECQHTMHVQAGSSSTDTVYNYSSMYSIEAYYR
jgi:hypothetical protein